MLKPRKPTAAPALILTYWVLALVLLLDVVSGMRVSLVFGLVGTLRAPAPGSTLTIHLANTLLLVAASVLFLQRLRQEPSIWRDLPARGSWRRAHALVSQSFFALVALQALCALLLALGGGIGLARLHLVTTLLMIAAVPVHVGIQLRLGGSRHVLRMLRPTPAPHRAVPLGRVAETALRPVRRVGLHRLFGLALGMVFGAAAATAYVAATDAPHRRVAGLEHTVVPVAWGLPLRPER